MPAWTQDTSRCFVALLQSYIRCQSELKAASAASLLRYNLCQPENKNLTLLRLRREVRLQERVWNDIMAFFVVLDSFELQMMAELIKRGRNDKMWRVVRLPFFGEWPPDDVFFISLSFRGQRKEEGGRTNEKSGMLFYRIFSMIAVSRQYLNWPWPFCLQYGKCIGRKVSKQCCAQMHFAAWSQSLSCRHFCR